MNNVQAYPLSWPREFPRAKSRDKGTFKTSLSGAIRNVQDSLRLFSLDSGKKLDNIIISSNVSLGVSKPDDPGVSVWFTWDSMDLCIAVDRYQTVEANLQAIHHILEARRVELRHGTLALVRATFQGFRALPAPSSEKSWREVLGVPADENDLEVVKQAYRRKVAETHPDRGGSHDKTTEINRAWEEAQEALKA